MKIGIALIATNGYFVLGLRFIRRWVHFYKGNSEVVFYFFSDEDPKPYLKNVDVDVVFVKTSHKSWVEGTNSKFKNILDLDTDVDYLYYFDADTNINKEFTEDWMIGDIVGGEHYGNKTMNPKPYDRNPKSTAYIPKNTDREEVYYYGAFFGGKTINVMRMCTKLLLNQAEDQKINYEPAVNDESYINNYFHYNPPHMVPVNKFQFIVSDKGGIGETRNMKLETSTLKEQILELEGKLFDIQNGKII